ncbi:hypothetical protein SL1157_1008 [Ruegeria lacuscaerulensis ITI-1157]|nr:hypothetical protein SL1157_1008 [Ruegeria lacuscaerulensis ITI-1157]
MHGDPPLWPARCVRHGPQFEAPAEKRNRGVGERSVMWMGIGLKEPGRVIINSYQINPKTKIFLMAGICYDLAYSSGLRSAPF